ncbi:S26 family signal peptidase, partial [Chloroflexota bacterium]
MRGFFRDTLTTLILALIIFFGARTTIQHTIVISSSMEPSLQIGQHLIINKLAYSYKLNEPKRGDII